MMLLILTILTVCLLLMLALTRILWRDAHIAGGGLSTLLVWVFLILTVLGDITLVVGIVGMVLKFTGVL